MKIRFQMILPTLLFGLVGALAWGPCTARSEDAAGDESPPVSQEESVALPVLETEELDLAMPELELFAEALLHVRKHYVSEKTYHEIISGALHGMLETLDPHSSFLEVDDYEDMRDDTTGQFSGIGIHIAIKDGHPTVIAPIEGTPAFRAGLQSGDRILSIDGTRVDGTDLQDAVKKLRGATGSTVVLVVHSPQQKEPREVTVVRENITVPSIRGKSIIRDNIGYLRITQFSAPTVEALKTALTELVAEGMDALVLDLRGNPGGLLVSAVDVSSLFLAPGQTIVTTKGRQQVYGERSSRSRGDLHFTHFPMAVLINGGSASASEIVAGALQDHGRAVLVGTTTFGKASVQSVIPLGKDDKEALRLTIAHYYTPSGREIHEHGVDPDIVVDVDPAEWRRVQVRRSHLESPLLFDDEVKAEYENAVDQQLQRAVDLLQAVKIFK